MRTHSSFQADTRPRPDIDRLGRALRGRLITQSDDGWDQARKVWNRRIEQRPLAIVDVTDRSDVVTTVSYAADHGLGVSTQVLGHGAGIPLDETILIRTSRWRGVTLEPDRRRARIAPGTLWRDLLAATDPVSLTGLPGTGADVSVTGYSLHGGAGLLGRKFGFAANDVVSAEVVTADGHLVRVDDTSCSDLFWALRGGGGGFGVVVDLEIDLHPAPQLYGGQLMWSAQHAREVLLAWRQWTDALPPELTSMAAVITLPPFPEVPEGLRGKTAAMVTLCHLGGPDDAERLIRPLREVAPPMVDSLRPLRVGELGSVRFEPNMPLAVRMHADLLKDLPAKAVDIVIEAATEPPPVAPLGMIEVRHLGGAFATPVAGQGAIGHVEAPFLVEALGFTPDPERDLAVQTAEARLSQAFGRWRTGTTLPSFLHPEGDGERVFDPATCDRLRQVKRRYDPSGTLRPTFSFLSALQEPTSGEVRLEAAS